MFFATAPKHMEDLLAEELKGLGIEPVRPTRAGVEFGARLEDAYRACLWSRVANRILMPLLSFPCPNATALYEGIQRVQWDDHLVSNGTLAVDFSGGNAEIKHTHFGALRVKDAVVDWFMERYQERPSVSLDRPDLRIHVHLGGPLDRSTATLSLDLSGGSLHRRGYRTEGGAAPLKENLAAAILLRAGWPEVAAAGGTLLDPLCGSGTLCLEAAWMAADWAPGLLRSEADPHAWGFDGWLGHVPAVWNRLLEDARTRREAGLARMPTIIGYDADPGAVRIALANIERAGLRGRVHCERRALADLTPPSGKPGLVVTNPPYGERLGDRETLLPLYTAFGDRLKAGFPGWRAAIFTGNPDLGKAVGIRARRMHTLFNGPLECKLLHFEITPEWFHRPPLPDATPPAPDLDLANHPFANRLRKNLRQMEKWARREGITCYRVYDADIPEFAVAIDRYEQWVNVQEYAAPADKDPRLAAQRLGEVMACLPGVLGVPAEHCFLKVRQRQKGAAQYEKLDDERVFHEVQEAGATLLVNFTDYLDTGLFLDHRPTRLMIRELARGRRFLNLFCYTGTATVHAALGGATESVSVDLSATYLNWARRNLARNGFSEHKHRFVQSDVREWLGIERSRFGLIFLDPPTFSNSKRMEGVFDVQRDHVEMIHACMDHLERDGVLIFSNNHRRFRLEEGELADYRVEEISARTLPEDFKRSPRIHRCWRIEHLR